MSPFNPSGDFLFGRVVYNIRHKKMLWQSGGQPGLHDSAVISVCITSGMN